MTFKKSLFEVVWCNLRDHGIMGTYNPLICYIFDFNFYFLIYFIKLFFNKFFLKWNSLHWPPESLESQLKMTSSQPLWSLVAPRFVIDRPIRRRYSWWSISKIIIFFLKVKVFELIFRGWIWHTNLKIR